MTTDTYGVDGRPRNVADVRIRRAAGFAGRHPASGSDPANRSGSWRDSQEPSSTQGESPGAPSNRGSVKSVRFRGTPWCGTWHSRGNDERTQDLPGRSEHQADVPPGKGLRWDENGNGDGGRERITRGTEQRSLREIRGPRLTIDCRAPFLRFSVVEPFPPFSPLPPESAISWNS
jgi:hypothetical protein